MRIAFAVVFSCVVGSGLAQSANSYRSVLSGNESAVYSSRKFLSGIQMGRLSTLRMMTPLTGNNDMGSEPYWAASVTSQSYGKGKMGTFYYWDVQGNLREMRGFLDIAGKNKRGLKLVFPWR